MQQNQHTTTSNVVYDLSSVLYHSLQAAQKCASYIEDAEKAGQKDVVSFLHDFQQSANKNAEQARRLLTQMGNA